MEYFDICDTNGQPTGAIISREEAHDKGILHRTAHVWIVRNFEGRTQVLLQKRSLNKDSYPGLYDTSSAGHIPAGSEPLPSALRELEEELGISATPEQLTYIGHFFIQYEEVFHDKPFRDYEYSYVYLYTDPVDIDTLVLQESEVESVRWFDIDEVNIEKGGETRFCVPAAGLQLLKEYLA